jgi:short-subunit dehydrogenase
MKDKGVAIITGASRGIGHCLAKGLAEDGYKCVLIARDEQRLQILVNEISEIVPTELKPEYLSIDVTDHHKVIKAMSRLTRQNRRLSILVNNAGMWLGGTLKESPEKFTKLLTTNLVSPYVFIKVIIEEYHTYMNNPVAKAFLEFRTIFFNNNPYQISPLGTIEKKRYYHLCKCAYPAGINYLGMFSSHS